MKFILDNNLPPKLAEHLRLMGFEVKHIRDHYERGDVPDEEWILEMARLGWVAITHDRKIASKPSEREALQRSGLTIVFVKKGVGALPLNKQIGFFIGHWDEMVEVVKTAKPGKCWFAWQVNGKVKPYED